MIEQFTTDGSVPKKQANQAAIVFVHGFTGDWKNTWRSIPDVLLKDPRLSGWDLFGFGYASHRSFDILGLWSSDAKLEEISTMLHAEPALNPYERLVLVAHSMGGLVVQRALVKYPDLRARTSHAFFFGTPSAGLVKASLLSFFKQQIQNMNASGDFILKLRKDWDDLKLSSGHPFKLFATAGEMDQFVPPESSLGPFPESVQRVIPGNHITMLAEAAAAQILVNGLTANTAGTGARNSAAVAIETGRFQKVIDQLWPNRAQLDDGGAVQLALALDGCRRREDAIQLLQEHKSEGPDVIEVLAGRLKRRWVVERKRSDVIRAMELYQRGYDLATGKTPPDHDQAYYSGINLAYLEMAYGQDYTAARARAEQVLEHCAAAVRSDSKKWKLATEGDAMVILGRLDEAYAKHAEAAREKLAPWEAFSIEEQSVRIADACGLTEDQARKLVSPYLM